MQPAGLVDFVELSAVRAADRGRAAELVLRAFAGRENARLGLGYVEAWLRSFGPDSLIRTAGHGEQMLGIVVGTPERNEVGRYRTLRAAALLALARRPWRALQPSVVGMGLRRSLAWRATPGPPCWYLAILGVDPAARGRGIGSALLDCFEVEGYREGWGQAALHVRRNDPAARRLYQRAGWSVTARVWPGRLRMEKRLGGP